MKNNEKRKIRNKRLAYIGVILLGLGLAAADSEGIGMWIALTMIVVGMMMIFPAHQDWMEEQDEEINE